MSVWVFRKADTKTDLDVQEIYSGNTCEGLTSVERKRTGKRIGREEPQSAVQLRSLNLADRAKVSCWGSP